MDLRSFFSVKTHFDRHSKEEVSQTSTILCYFLLHVLRAFLLTLCVVTSHLESARRRSCCCRPKLRGYRHHHFRDHPAFQGSWSKGYLFGKKGMLLVGGWESTVGLIGSFTIHACPIFHDRCWVLAMKGRYPLWWGLTDDMEYDEFSKTRLMPASFRRYASFSLHLPSFFFSCISTHNDI